MTIGKKITLLCCTLLVLTLTLGYSALIHMRHISRESALLVSNTVPTVYLASRINTGAKAILIRILRHMSSDNLEQMKKFESYLNDRNQSVREEMQAYERLVLTEKDRQLVERICADLDRTIAVWQRVRPLSLARKKREAVELFDREGVAASDDLDTAAKDLVALNKAESEAIGKQVAASISEARLWVVGILLATFASGGAFAFFLVRSLNRALRHTVEKVSTEAVEVMDAANLIAAASQALAEAASRQAAALEQTTSSGVAISSTASRTAVNTNSAAALVEQSQERSSEASRNLKQMTNAIREIDVSSNRISEIMRDIDEVSFQTNILALNAAVEAARAGEAGTGFAVVADEVRSLARRSAAAASKTASLIEETISKSGDGREIMQRVTQSIGAMAEVSRQVRELVLQVKHDSGDQAQCIEQLAQAMVQVKELTQTTAASAQQGAVTAGQLKERAGALHRHVALLAAISGDSKSRSG